MRVLEWPDEARGGDQHAHALEHDQEEGGVRRQVEASILLLGRDNVDSSKLEEYRLVPKGLSMPVFTLQGSQDGNAYALFGQSISKDDQRYRGWANIGWLGMTFDYNQIPHNMGNDGRTLHARRPRACGA